MPRKKYNLPVPKDYGTGLIPRPLKKFPIGCFAYAAEFPDSELIPDSEWSERFEKMRSDKTGLLDLRKEYYDILHSYDQNGFGLCWAFSSTKASAYHRVLSGLTPMRLSAYWVAGQVKGWRDQGGWGAESLEMLVGSGAPVESYCPKYSRQYDTPDARANAALHKVTEWWDGSDNPTKAQKQLVSMLLQGRPCVVDLNVMGHSMCAIDIGSLNPLEIIYDNSWGDGGEDGLYRGRGAYARPDGLVIPRVVTASIK